jgi:DNA-binding NtrC family response regulator
MRLPTLLVVDDDPELLEAANEALREAGYLVLLANSTKTGHEILRQEFVDLLLLDERISIDSGIRFLEEEREAIPGLNGVMVTGYADLKYAVQAMRAGVLDLVEKPFDYERLLEAVARALKSSELIREGRYQRWQSARSGGFGRIVGESAPMRRAILEARRVAASDVPILVLGESGSGKDVFAKAIHEESPRRGGPCLSVNASAIAPSLVESTLFGHGRGAFTGADREHRGLFEQAHGGTLFLDEIGEMPLELQVKLLRVLEERHVTRLGTARPIPVDVRIVTATNRSLREEVAARRFREDLYYRLAGYTLTLPPLRDRGEDMLMLANLFLGRYTEAYRLPLDGFSEEAKKALGSYAWPGNVRQLENVVRGAVLRATSTVVQVGDLDLWMPAGAASSGLTVEAVTVPYREALESFEQDYFERLLASTDGNKSEAARVAGLDRSSLHSHLRKLSKS